MAYDVVRTKSNGASCLLACDDIDSRSLLAGELPAIPTSRDRDCTMAMAGDVSEVLRR